MSQMEILKDSVRELIGSISEGEILFNPDVTQLASEILERLAAL